MITTERTQTTVSLARKKNSTTMDIDAIRQLVSEDMQSVDRLIHQRLKSEVVLVNQLGRYIVNSGGKRLRPLLALISAGTFGYSGKQHINLAAIIEFIHTATLVHDDVVDASELRRGKETANSIWGNEASVLVGDFLYSRAFEMMVEVGEMRIMEIMARATNVIAEGEVLQLLNCNNPDTNEQHYLEVIRCKTAKLFEAACQLGAILCQRSATEEQAMKSYGMHLGTAFQLVDDILDYSASSDVIGKNIGDDLAEGKPTLPLIYAMQTGTTEQAALIHTAIEEGGHDHIDAVMKIIDATDALSYTSQAAKAEAKKAADAIIDFPDSPYKDALLALTQFAVQRNY